MNNGTNASCRTNCSNGVTIALFVRVKYGVLIIGFLQMIHLLDHLCKHCLCTLYLQLQFAFLNTLFVVSKQIKHGFIINIIDLLLYE